MHLFTLHKSRAMSLKFLKVIVKGIIFSPSFFLAPTVSFLARENAIPGEVLEGVGETHSMWPVQLQ